MDNIISIGVNAYEANIAKRVGSNKYAFEILLELEKLTRPQASSPDLNVADSKFQHIEWTIYLPSPVLIDLPKSRPGFTYKVIPPAKMWTQWRLPFELYFGGAHHDVFLSLGHYSPRFSPFPTVICILDLAFLKFPQFFLKKDLYQLREWTRYSVKQASHIFTISESTKADIINEYQKKAEEITIAYPGITWEPKTSEQTLDPFSQESQSILSKFSLQSKQYIISIGTIQPRKNIISAIKAFEIFNRNHHDAYKLVLIGKPGWMTDEFDRAVNDSPQKENIVRTGFIDDREKYLLLREAACSVLVGYYEGFGIPAIESLSSGIPPVVANAASLPEVVGKFGVLVDPYSIDSIAGGFETAVSNPPSSMLRAEMREWANQFSWETSSKKILEVLVEKFQKPQSKSQ